MQTNQTTRRNFLGTTIRTAGVIAAVPLFGQSAAPNPDRVPEFLRAVEAGDIKRVTELLDKEPGLVQARDASNRSAFAIATLHRQKEVAELLRTRGYEPDLHEAALALDWELFENLASKHPSEVNGDHPLGGSTMYAAALGGAGTNIWRVYAQAGEPNIIAAKGEVSPLRAALEFHDLAVAELTAATILGNGGVANPPEPDNHTALHVAASRGSYELTEMLIRQGAVVDARDENGRTPIELAERNLHAKIVELLQNNNQIPREHIASRRAFDANGNRYTPADIDSIAYKDRSAVVGAAHAKFDVVREALQKDPRLAHSVATTNEGAVEAGAHMGRVDIVDLLLEHGAPYSLPTAVMRDDIARVKASLTEDPKRINERGAHDFALLWYPIIGSGSIELMEILLDAGAQIEQQHHLGTTALHWAAMNGQIDIARLLIERGANVNRTGRKFGGRPETPIELARRGEQEEMVTLLKQFGAHE